MVHKNIEDFLKKPMTRKEFVRHIGLLLLSALGAGTLLRYLGQNNFIPELSKNGYGTSAYGGQTTRTIS